ncbi:hypothetical protein RvY_04517 [Ramazzottius varieornatus]|uniref:DDE Tnp4 domain-containing protein n=1 Tax=Ramazzottius varieornatus TaxID=947166 RepID=A0A1D1URV6_RAMVA|nr:hypothetical protein RvY_04517 [Ramazzottius varieornatus]
MVLSKIVGHNLHGKIPQADPRLQLMICAYRFESSGSSGFVRKIARRFGVSEGSVLFRTTRCTEALLSVEGSVVDWPDKEERTTIKARILRDSGFPDCIGMLDSTLVPLEYKPTKNCEDYWSDTEYQRWCAYTMSTPTIASYKKPAAGVMSANNERFYFYHSSTRIKIEHTIGMFEGTFSVFAVFKN